MKITNSKECDLQKSKRKKSFFLLLEMYYSKKRNKNTQGQPKSPIQSKIVKSNQLQLIILK